MNKILMSDLIWVCAEALNLIDKRLSDHNKQVAFIASEMAECMNFDSERTNSLVIAGLFHDIGAFEEEEKKRMIEFMTESQDKVQNHALIGSLILKTNPYFTKIAEIIRHHHTVWNNGKFSKDISCEIPFESHMLFIADRLAILLKECDMENVLMKGKVAVEMIEMGTGRLFMPELVDTMRLITKKPSFFFSVVSNYKEDILKELLRKNETIVEYAQISEVARFLVFVIDFRSRYTATHTIGVSSTAEIIGEKMGLNEEQLLILKISGYFHDIGKLAIPLSILEKNGILTKDEFDVIKSHTYYTYYLLNKIRGMENIRDIASFHHEKLNGKGYPFIKSGKDISLEIGIIAVADIFSAITEDRPYRKGMHKNEAIEILKKMAEEKAINDEIVTLVIENYDEIFANNISIQKQAYENFYEIYNLVLKK